MSNAALFRNIREAIASKRFLGEGVQELADVLASAMGDTGPIEINEPIEILNNAKSEAFKVFDAGGSSRAMSIVNGNNEVAQFGIGLQNLGILANQIIEIPDFAVDPTLAQQYYSNQGGFGATTAVDGNIPVTSEGTTGLFDTGYNTGTGRAGSNKVIGSLASNTFTPIPGMTSELGNMVRTGVGATYRLLDSASVSSGSSMTVVDSSGIDFDVYKIWIRLSDSGNNTATFWLQTSSDGGSTYDNSGSDYLWTHFEAAGAAISANGDAGTNTDGIALHFSSMTSGSNDWIELELTVNSPADASRHTRMDWCGSLGSGATYIGGNATRSEDGAVDAFKIIADDSSIVPQGYSFTGEMVLAGLKLGF